MTQITLIGKYHDKVFNATEIFHILKEIFEDDSMAYSSITYHLRKKSWTEIPEEAKNRGGRPPNYRIDFLILQELNSDCRLSCHQIAKNIGYSYTSVRYVLTERLDYKPYNLRQVQHVLNFGQKQISFDYSIKLIEILKRAKKNGWQFISTGDESWFFYRTPGGIIWLP